MRQLGLVGALVAIAACSSSRWPGLRRARLPPAAQASPATPQTAAADEPPPPSKQVNYSPYPTKTFPDRVYWGDTHLHTSYSTDAGMIGAVLGPEEAYRFARGEAMKSNHGAPVQLQRPYDFLVVSDHAENLGLAPLIAESNPELLKSEWGKKVHDLVKAGKGFEAYNVWGSAMLARQDPLKAQAQTIARPAWQRITAAAEKYNEPGRFTAIIGFEWSAGPNGNNLHRNILFRDGKDKADQIIPLSSYDTEDPEELWKWMADYENKTGGRLLAIPHNGNLSNGLMFDDVTLTTKKPLDRDYAERRQRWEPLYETTQMKGDGETHPSLSPSDEFANFERWDKGSFGPELKTPAMLPREYTREALKRGLAYEQQLGVNPFKFGLIGSTDSHTGLSTAQENNFFGKVAMLEPSADPIRFDEVNDRPLSRGARPQEPATSRGRPAYPAWLRSGRAGILVRRCGTRWHARRCTPRRGPASSCACSAAMTLRPPISRSAISRRTGTRRASPWAATSRPRPRERRRCSWCARCAMQTAPTSIASR